MVAEKLYNDSLTPSTIPAAIRLRGAVALRRHWASDLAPPLVALISAWLVALLAEWLVALLVALLVEWDVDSLLLLFSSGSGLRGGRRHHDLTLGYSVALVATASAVLDKKVGVARWRLKGRCRVRGRGLSGLLLQVVALPSPASLVSAIFCTSMRLDRFAESSFLLALCSWAMGL